MGITPFFDDLNATLDTAWRLLEQGVVDVRSSMHTPTLATTGPDGRPNARTVVLRGVEKPARRLVFYTDQRSRKYQELEEIPWGMVVAYDPSQRIQIQAAGPVSLHNCDAVAQQHWEQMRPLSRRNYLVEPGPGGRLNEPGNGLPEGLAWRPPTDRESGPGQQRFSVMVMTVETLDWLYLAHLSQRRAHFRWEGERRVAAEWQVP